MPTKMTGRRWFWSVPGECWHKSRRETGVSWEPPLSRSRVNHARAPLAEARTPRKEVHGARDQLGEAQLDVAGERGVRWRTRNYGKTCGENEKTRFWNQILAVCPLLDPGTPLL